MPTDTPMQLGMVGLGRMGAGIVRRLTRDGHHCVGFDVNADAVKALEGDGIPGTTSLEEFVGKLDKPRTVWVMVPAGEITVADDRQPQPRCSRPATSIIDGGNTHYHDDIRHAKELGEKGIHHVDCRHQRRRLRTRARLLPDDRRRGRRRRAPVSDVRVDRPGGRRRPRGRRGGPVTQARRRAATSTAARTAPGTS